MSGTASWGRRGLLALLFVLACIGVALSTVAVWAHQTVLATDRFVATVERVVDQPEVQAFAADRLASQVITAADVEARIATILPPPQAFLAAPLADGIERIVEERLTGLFANERAQAALVAAAGATHQRLIAVLRGESDVVTIEGTTVTIDLLPIAVQGLAELQSLGVLPTTVTLPDVSDPAAREAAIASLEDRLGRDLPEDFALVTVADATRLAAAQGIVRAFDVVVVALVLATAALCVATVVIARHRLRMVAALALGVVVAIIVARMLTRTLVAGVSASMAADGSGDVLNLMIQDLTADLANWTWILVALGLVVAATAAVLARPAWLTTGADALTAPTSRSERMAGWLRDHADGIGWTVAIILVVVLSSIVATPELAILVGIGLVLLAWSGLLRRGTSADGSQGVAPSSPAVTPNGTSAPSRRPRRPSKPRG